MAVKVVYDATRGLVQENDPTGAGGFDIKDTFLDQGTELNILAETAPAAIPALQPFGVSVVNTGVSGDSVTLADGTAVGQIKIVVYKEALSGTTTDDLVVTVANGNDVTLADEGDVAMLVWSGAKWLTVGQSS
jgi:hypothetical protein